MFQSLSLTNIKSFQEAQIPLGDFTVILGANASGKSNIRDAFRFLHGLSRGYKLVDVLGGRYEGGDLVWQGVRGGPNQFITRINQNTKISQGRIAARSTAFFNYSLVISSQSSKYPCIINESLKDIQGNDIYYAWGMPLHVNIPESGAFLVSADEAVLNQREKIFLKEKDKKIKLQSIANEVIAEFSNMRFIDLYPGTLREPSYPGQHQLGDRGENLSTVLQHLFRYTSYRDDIVEWLRALTPMDVADIAFERDGRGRVSLVLVEHNKRKTSVESASDGTLRFLAYLALAFSTEKPTTCFIEELDNGIHPSRLRLLVELIETQTKKRNLQVIATSHSPALLNLLNKESLDSALLVYRTEGSDSSKVKPLHQLPHFSEIVERRNPGSLMESGWFENTVEALEYEEEQPS